MLWVLRHCPEATVKLAMAICRDVRSAVVRRFLPYTKDLEATNVGLIARVYTLEATTASHERELLVVRRANDHLTRERLRQDLDA